MAVGKRLAVVASVSVVLAGCGGGYWKPGEPRVCTVRPNPGGSLLASPKGCLNHLKGATLNILTK